VDGSFLESLPKMEEHPERFERSPIDGDIVSSAATIPTRDDAESSPRSDSGMFHKHLYSIFASILVSLFKIYRPCAPILIYIAVYY